MAHKGEERRQRILAAYEQYERQYGCPPTVREIARAVGIKSTSNVVYHLNVLEEQGYLARTPGAARGRQLAQRPGVPVLGNIAAGVPLSIYEPGERDVLDLGRHLREAGTGRAEFALLVRGDSMIEDHIFDGDYVLVHPGPDASNGAIVVAVQPLEGGALGAATVKRFYRDDDRRVVRLVPANSALTPRIISAEEWDHEWAIHGTVTGVYRPCWVRPHAALRSASHAAGER